MISVSLSEAAPFPRWVGWRNERRGDDVTKVPYAPFGGRKAEADDPSTWAPRAAAEEWVRRAQMDQGGGVGIELGEFADLREGLSLAGVDLDTCRDPATGAIEPWAMHLVQRLNSYAEISPSETGLKIFFTYATADLPKVRENMGGALHGKQFKRGKGKHAPAIELHLGNRYFTVTERHLQGTPDAMRPVDVRDLLWIVREAGPAFVRAGQAQQEFTEAPRDKPEPQQGSGHSDLLSRLAQILPWRSRLARRWAGSSEGLQDSTRSGMDMSMMALLRREGFSFEECRTLLLQWPHGAGRDRAGDDRYWQRMWDRGTSESSQDQQGPTPEPDEAPKEKRSVPLSMIDPRKWTELPPPRQWIVPGWVPRGVVTGLYGDGGVGKSLLAMQLLTSSALCLPWLGIDVTPGRALGVFCEDDDDELQRRQWAINRLYGVEPENLENLRYLSRLGQDNALLQFDGSDIGRPTAFASQLHGLCGEFRPDLLVLDTAADLFPANENDRGKVRQFVQTTLGGFARTHNCAVLLLAHPSVSGMSSGTGSSGSTAWNNTMRSRFYLSRPDGEDVDPDSRVLSRKKANYASRDAEIRIKWQDGAFDLLTPGNVPSLTWEQIDAVFDELAKGWAAGKPWSLYSQTRKGGRFLPDWAREYLQIPPKRLEKAISDWIRNGFVAYEEYDRHSKAKGLRVVRRLSPDAA